MTLRFSKLNLCRCDTNWGQNWSLVPGIFDLRWATWNREVALLNRPADAAEFGEFSHQRVMGIFNPDAWNQQVMGIFNPDAWSRDNVTGQLVFNPMGAGGQ